MVAAHDWDVWGAMQAGWAAAYVARTDVPFGLGHPPDIVGRDLAAVADAIVLVDGPAGRRAPPLTGAAG
jgi:2-haloacid dehalogenase